MLFRSFCAFLFISYIIFLQCWSKVWTLCTFDNISSFSPSPLHHPPTKHRCRFIQGRLAIPTLLEGRGGLEKLNYDFRLQNNASPVGICSSVPRTFGQDCKYLKFLKFHATYNILKNAESMHHLFSRC